MNDYLIWLLLRKLPPFDERWSSETRIRWLRCFEMIVNLAFSPKREGGYPKTERVNRLIEQGKVL